MPSPLGHFVAGAAISLATHQRANDRPSSVPWIACGLLAVLPDLDLLVPGTHRTLTHSLAAAGLVGLVTAYLSSSKSGAINLRLCIAYTLAYGSHLVIDYFGVDHGTPAGLQLLWPWPDWFISSVPLFRSTERHDPFSWFAMSSNALAVAQEMLILGPITLLAWMTRRRRAAAAESTKTPWPVQRVR